MQHSKRRKAQTVKFRPAYQFIHELMQEEFESLCLISGIVSYGC